jgi:hypothetical protein
MKLIYFGPRALSYIVDLLAPVSTIQPIKKLTDARLGEIYAAVLASVEVAERSCKRVVVKA